MHGKSVSRKTQCKGSTVHVYGYKTKVCTLLAFLNKDQSTLLTDVCVACVGNCKNFFKAISTVYTHCQVQRCYVAAWQYAYGSCVFLVYFYYFLFDTGERKLVSGVPRIVERHER